MVCLKEVPNAMKACLDASGVGIDEVKKIFIHQANMKMDEALLNASIVSIETHWNRFFMNIQANGIAQLQRFPILRSSIERSNRWT